MKKILFPALSALHFGMILRAKAGEEGSGEETQANISTGEDRNEPATQEAPQEAPQDQASARRGRAMFTPEQIKEIRALRAEKREDGKPLHSHAALAKQFGTTAGAISHIVRNRTYVDKTYTPTNDGA